MADLDRAGADTKHGFGAQSPDVEGSVSAGAAIGGRHGGQGPVVALATADGLACGASPRRSLTRGTSRSCDDNSTAIARCPKLTPRRPSLMPSARKGALRSHATPRGASNCGCGTEEGVTPTARRPSDLRRLRWRQKPAGGDR